MHLALLLPFLAISAHQPETSALPPSFSVRVSEREENLSTSESDEPFGVCMCVCVYREHPCLWLP